VGSFRSSLHLFVASAEHLPLLSFSLKQVPTRSKLSGGCRISSSESSQVEKPRCILFGRSEFHLPSFFLSEAKVDATFLLAEHLSLLSLRPSKDMSSAKRSSREKLSTSMGGTKVSFSSLTLDLSSSTRNNPDPSLLFVHGDSSKPVLLQPVLWRTESCLPQGESCSHWWNLG